MATLALIITLLIADYFAKHQNNIYPKNVDFQKNLKDLYVPSLKIFLNLTSIGQHVEAKQINRSK